MFWKQCDQQNAATIDCLNAVDIVSRVGRIYSDLNEQDQLVKPLSSLPCSLFSVRECFKVAYEAEYEQLSKSLRDSYHHVYRELAFFVDNALFDEFTASLSVAAKCQSDRHKEMGLPFNEISHLGRIDSSLVRTEDRKKIWERLARETTCPTRHLRLLAETLSYCSDLHRAYWDEWAAFANLVAYRNKERV